MADYDDDDVSTLDGPFFGEVSDQIYSLDMTSGNGEIGMIPGDTARCLHKEPEHINVLEEVMKIVDDDGEETFESKIEKIDEQQENFKKIEREMVEVEYEAMSGVMEDSKLVIEDYDIMRKYVMILKHNIGRVTPQTKFDSQKMFQPFYQVEQLTQELRIIKDAEVIAQAPDRLAEFETDKFWLHAVEKLMEIADALDPQKTDSELSKIPAFHHMNSKISKQRDDYGVKLVLPALYSHLYCESETCWELKRGRISRIESKLRPLREYKIEEELAPERSLEEMEDLTVADAEDDSAHYMALCIESISRLRPRKFQFQKALNEIGKTIPDKLIALINNCLEDVESDRFVFGGDLDTISILPMDEDRRSGSSVGASLSNAVHPASKKQMIELLQALFHQCVRVLHNHSFVVRTILYEKEKAEDESVKIAAIHNLVQSGDNNLKTPWEHMQSVLQEFFEQYWAKPAALVEDIAAIADTSQEFAFTFKFEDVYSHNSGTEVDYEKDEGHALPFNHVRDLQPSPLHVCWSYPWIRNFIDEVSKIASDHLSCPWVEERFDAISPESCDLGIFVDDYVRNKYFVYVRDQVMECLGKAMTSVDAFKPMSRRHKFVQNKHGQHHGDLLAAGVHTLEIIEYLWNSMLEMPNEAFVIAPGEEHDTFISLIVEVLKFYKTECEVKLQSIIAPPDPESKEPVQTATAVRLPTDPGSKHKHNHADASEGAQAYADFLMNEDPQLAALQYKRRDHELESERRVHSGEDPEEPKARPSDCSPTDEKNKRFHLREQAFDLELHELLTNDPKDRESLRLMHRSGAVLLAGMSNTLDWLASQVVEMVKKSPKEFPGAMRDVWSRTLRVAIPQVVTVAQSYTELSDSCLIYLRTELRHICFNELKFIQEDCVADDHDSETDETILQLSRNLSEFEYRLSRYLSPQKRSYLFIQLGWVVADILVTSLRCITDINPAGARKRASMIYPFFKNVGNFVSKVDPKIFDIVFSRVRSYYGPFAAREPHQAIEMSLKAGGRDHSGEGTPLHLRFTLTEIDVLFNKTKGKGDQNSQWSDLEALYNAQSNETDEQFIKEIRRKNPELDELKVKKKANST